MALQTRHQTLPGVWDFLHLDPLVGKLHRPPGQSICLYVCLFVTHIYPLTKLALDPDPSVGD